MADRTKIEWTDATVNAVNGCSVLSPGCANCYAMRLAGTRMRNHPSRAGLTQDSKAGPVWTGEVRLNEKALLQPLRWAKPRMIFWNAHGDLFHENVPDEWIDRVFAVCALTPQHTHQILTKRAERMRAYFDALTVGTSLYRPYVHRPGWKAPDPRDRDRVLLLKEGQSWPLPNVWLGVSVEDQKRADERIPHLLATPAAVRFLSCEPLLGPVNIEPWLAPDKTCQGCDDGEGYGNRCASDQIPRDEQCPWKRSVQVIIEHGPFDAEGMPTSVTSEVQTVDWVIVGGESGPGARPMHPDWARSLRDQCAAAGVSFFFKQWGEWREWDDGSGDPEPEEVENDSETADAIYASAIRPAFITQDGRVFRRASLPEDEPCRLVERVGKKSAGRLLDGVEHNGMPS